MSASPRELTLTLCPRCDGQTFDVGSCSVCENTGLLDQDARPFHAPPPFDGWTPAKLAELSRSSTERRRKAAGTRTIRYLERLTMTRDEHDQAAVHVAPNRKLTQSEIIELLIAAASKAGAEHSTVRLSRNAKGDTQIEVSVRTGEGGIDTVEQARMKAQEEYDHLRKLYPLALGS